MDKRKYERIESQVKEELRRRGITSEGGDDVSPYLVQDAGDYWSVVIDETIKVKKKV